jgi:predicted DCC family thiol-disulfide oxidoreductase YuxK
MTDIFLVYDKQCPACHYYSHIVKIRDDVGTLILVNARDNNAIMHEITDKGWNMDQGMVLKVGRALYYGADAIHILSMMSSQSDWFNRCHYWVFRSKTSARFLYPILKGLRNMLLKFLGVTKINNLGLENNHTF